MHSLVGVNSTPHDSNEDDPKQHVSHFPSHSPPPEVFFTEVFEFYNVSMMISVQLGLIELAQCVRDRKYGSE